MHEYTRHAARLRARTLFAFYGQGVGIDGYILAAILTLFFVYLFPSLIRSAQVVRESRVEDRFSAKLRIIATSGVSVGGVTARSSNERPYLHPKTLTSRHRSDSKMTTPVAHKLAAADARRLAAARAARAAALSRRAAAAKRRVALLSVFGALTISGWILASMTAFTPIVPAVLTAFTVGVVELGRRAARDGVRADVKLAEAVSVAEARLTGSRAPVATKIATPPARDEGDATTEAPRATSSLRIETDPANATDTSSEATGFTGSASTRSRTAGEKDNSGWTPVPVPPPAYVLKSAAPRRLVAPIKVGEEPSPVAPSDSVTEFMDPVAARVQTARTETAARTEAAASAMGVAQAPAAGPGSDSSTDVAAAETTGSLNVQEILARRRAVG